MITPARSIQTPLFLALLAAALLTALPAITTAADPPDDYQAIRAVLPDSISLEDKVVYVDFWASWCAPCRHSFPWMQELYDQFRHLGLEVVAVSVDKDSEAGRKFVKENSSTFPVIYDTSGTFAELYELQAMPTSLLFDRDGRLIARYQGFRKEEADDLRADIQKLLHQERDK